MQSFFLIKSSFLFSLFLFALSLSAQQTIDSLKEEIQNLSLEEKIDKLADECCKNRFTNSLYSLDCGREAIKLIDQTGNKDKKVEILTCMGNAYRNLSDFSKALRNYTEALHLAEYLGDSLYVAESYNNIGTIYSLRQQYTAALSNFFEALQNFESLKDNAGKVKCLVKIGVIYKEQKNYDKALEYFNNTMKIPEANDDSLQRSVILNQFAEVYKDKNEYAKATVYYQKLLELNESINSKRGIGVALRGLGEIEEWRKNYRNALNYYSRALDISLDVDNIEEIVLNYSEISLLHAKMGNFDIADELLNQALKLIKRKETTVYLGDYYLTRSKYFEIKSDTGMALEYFKKYSSFKDSSSAAENIKSIASMEAFYQTEKALQEKNMMENESEIREKQRNYLLILVVLLFISVASVTYKYFQNKRINSRLKELNATKDKLFNLVAHDLKNPFNSLLAHTDMLIQSEMSEEEKSHAILGLNKSAKTLSRLVENLLQWARSNIGSLEFLPEEINLKLQVSEVVAFSKGSIDKKNIELIEEIDPSIDVYCDEQFLKTVLRNLVSNAVKFTGQGGIIKIEASEKGNFYEVSVSDTGVGIKKKDQEKLFTVGNTFTTTGTEDEKGTGLGLILCQEFVKKWGGKIFVESEPGKGSKFTVTIPKKKL